MPNLQKEPLVHDSRTNPSLPNRTETSSFLVPTAASHLLQGETLHRKEILILIFSLVSYKFRAIVSSILYASSYSDPPHILPLGGVETQEEQEQERKALSKMMKAVALIGGRRKSSRLFTDYYDEWIDNLKNTILPELRHSMSSSSASLLCTNVEILYRHFQAYYEALDLAASEDVSQLLYPEWRSPMEQPFLWFGDLHPNLFTNLLRSFLTDKDDDNYAHSDNFEKPLAFALAWKNPSEDLMRRIDQIECGLKLMIPAIVTQARNAQSGFIDRVAVDWVRYGGRKEATKAIGGAAKAQMEDLATVFVDANRLRRSMLSEIMSAINVFQEALYLERLAQFIVGFRDNELLRDFNQCKMPLSPAAAASS